MHETRFVIGMRQVEAILLVDKRRCKGAPSLITSPESFFVAAEEGPLEDGELERAVHWAHALFERFAAGIYLGDGV